MIPAMSLDWAKQARWADLPYSGPGEGIKPGRTLKQISIGASPKATQSRSPDEHVKVRPFAAEFPRSLRLYDRQVGFFLPARSQREVPRHKAAQGRGIRNSATQDWRFCLQ